MSLVARLRGGRDAAARGHLSLDRDQARAKLRMFRLPDPHFYVLQFVRAASVLGATRIEFEISASEMRCTFDRPFPAERLRDIWGAAFEERTDASGRAAYYLALGLGSAQALDPRFIEVTTQNVRLLLQDDQDRLTELPDSTPPIDGTQIQLKEKFRFGHVLEFLSTIGGQHAEEVALRDRCALAWIDISVNGKSIALEDLGRDTFVARFDGSDARGVAAVTPARQLDGWCMLLKDGVAVTRAQIVSHGAPVIGAVESSRIPTDLSGLAAQRSEEVTELLNDLFIPAYHKALLRWLVSDESDDADLLNALSGLLKYAKERGGTISPATQQAIDWLFTQRLFEDAVKPPGSPLISVNDATWPAIVRSSVLRFELRFELPNEMDHRPVLLIEPLQIEPHPQPRLMLNLLRESVVNAMWGGAVRQVFDMTPVLERKVQAARNEALWRSRPHRESVVRRFQRTFEVDDVVGRVYLPLESAGDELDVEQAGLFIYADSKLIRREAGHVRLGVEIDGLLVPAQLYDDVIRDERFTQVAVELCVATLDLHREFATALIEDGVAERAQPRLLDRFLQLLFAGIWDGEFLRSLGYAIDGVISLQEAERRRLAILNSFSHGQPVDQVLELLGPIAQVPCYEFADGTRATLAGVVARPNLSLLRRTDDWGSFRARVGAELSVEALSDIVVVDSIQEEIIRGIRADAPDARHAVAQRLARARYMAREEFDFAPPVETIRHTTIRFGDTDVWLGLMADASEASRVEFIWQGRRLGRRTFEPRYGHFLAVVRDDSITPNAEYDDLVDDARTLSMVAQIEARSIALVQRWFDERLAAADFASQAEVSLFTDIALDGARENRGRLLPVLQQRDDVWTTTFMSKDELAAEAARCGFVVSTSQSDTADAAALPDPSAPVMRVVSGRDDARRIQQLLGAQVRFVDATPSATSVSDRDRFLQKPFYHAPDPDSAPQRFVIDGLEFVTALIPDAESTSAPGDLETVDLSSAGALELARLIGVGPSVAANIIAYRAEHGFAKPSDLMRVPGIGPAKYEAMTSRVRVGAVQPPRTSSNLVTVLFAGRLLETIDVEVPLGRFRSTVTGDIVEQVGRFQPAFMGSKITPDPTYSFVAGGRATLISSARECAANTIRAVCDELQGKRRPQLDHLPLVRSLHRLLSTCLREEPKPPFDLRRTLAATPLFETCAATWISFDELESISKDGRIYVSASGDRADVLRCDDRAEIAWLSETIGGHYGLGMVQRQFDVAPQAATSTPQASTAGADPLLGGITRQLMDARGHRRDLFDDHLAATLRWALLDGALCRVSAAGVEIDARHPLVRMVREQGDRGARAFLASAVYSAINAWYRQITDHDELELQRELVRRMRG